MGKKWIWEKIKQNLKKVKEISSGTNMDKHAFVIFWLLWRGVCEDLCQQTQTILYIEFMSRIIPDSEISVYSCDTETTFSFLMLTCFTCNLCQSVRPFMPSTTVTVWGIWGRTFCPSNLDYGSWTHDNMSSQCALGMLKLLPCNNTVGAPLPTAPTHHICQPATSFCFCLFATGAVLQVLTTCLCDLTHRMSFSDIIVFHRSQFICLDWMMTKILNQRPKSK